MRRKREILKSRNVFVGFGAVYFLGVEFAVPSNDGGLLAGCDVSSSLRNGRIDSTP